MPFNKSPWDVEEPTDEPGRETRTFTDGDFELTLTMETLDAFNGGLTRDRADALIARYVTGENGRPPQPLMVGIKKPRVVPMSRSLCQMLGLLLTLERPETGNSWPEGQAPLTVSDWLGVMVEHDSVWQDVMDWVDRLSDQAGNASTAATVPGRTD